MLVDIFHGLFRKHKIRNRAYLTVAARQRRQVVYESVSASKCFRKLHYTGAKLTVGEHQMRLGVEEEGQV